MRRISLAVAVLSMTAVGAQSARGAVPNENAGRPIAAELSPGQEPFPGDEDATGTFRALVYPSDGTVCWDLAVSGIENAFVAHIHAGGVGHTGAPVLGFPVNSDGSAHGCRTIDRQAAIDLFVHPEDYYVNVHNQEFPRSAVRGQLHKG